MATELTTILQGWFRGCYLNMTAHQSQAVKTHNEYIFTQPAYDSRYNTGRLITSRSVADPQVFFDLDNPLDFAMYFNDMVIQLGSFIGTSGAREFFSTYSGLVSLVANYQDPFDRVDLHSLQMLLRIHDLYPQGHDVMERMDGMLDCYLKFYKPTKPVFMTTLRTMFEMALAVSAHISHGVSLGRHTFLPPQVVDLPYNDVLPILTSRQRTVNNIWETATQALGGKFKYYTRQYLPDAEFIQFSKQALLDTRRVLTERAARNNVFTANSNIYMTHVNVVGLEHLYKLR